MADVGLEPRVRFEPRRLDVALLELAGGLDESIEAREWDLFVREVVDLKIVLSNGVRAYLRAWELWPRAQEAGCSSVGPRAHYSGCW